MGAKYKCPYILVYSEPRSKRGGGKAMVSADEDTLDQSSDSIEACSKPPMRI